MSGIDDKEKILIKKVIDELLGKGKIELQNIKFESKDSLIKIKLLKMMFQSKKEEEVLYYNLKNKKINSNIQNMINKFLNNLLTYSVESCILDKDTISNSYYSIKDEELFASYFAKTKKNQIPFFEFVRFISFLNNDTDITNTITNFVKKNKYVKSYLNKYIEKVRGSLWKIFFLYNYHVLNIYDENEIGEKDEFFLFYDKSNIIGLFQQYICYNDCCGQGEISNFISTLYKSLTCNMNSLYLLQGNEFIIVNDLIQLIFRTIAEQFQNKNYHEKRQINDLYDIIADSIKNCSELTSEKNYAKFVVQYSRYYNQGNKMLVKLFLEGLNENNFQNCFKEIPMNINDNFYENIEKYINYIHCIKESKKKGKTDKSQDNIEKEFMEASSINSNNNKTTVKDEVKIEDNNIHNKSCENISNISYDIKDTKDNNDVLFTKDNKYTINKGEIKSEEKSQENKKNNILNIEPSNRQKDNKLNLDNAIIDLKAELMEEIKELKLKLISSDKKQLELEKKHQESLKKIQQNKKEISELKKEMKRINYRDISKIIINKYILKFFNKLQSIKTKKEKANFILTLLQNPEKTYFQKIVETYFDSNIKSHISYIIKEHEKKMIIGSNYDANSVINDICKDYCEKIIEEKDDDNIKNYIDLKKIIRELYDNYLKSIFHN